MSQQVEHLELLAQGPVPPSLEPNRRLRGESRQSWLRRHVEARGVDTGSDDAVRTYFLSIDGIGKARTETLMACWNGETDEIDSGTRTYISYHFQQFPPESWLFPEETQIALQRPIDDLAYYIRTNQFAPALISAAYDLIPVAKTLGVSTIGDFERLNINLHTLQTRLAQRGHGSAIAIQTVTRLTEINARIYRIGRE